MRLQIIIMAHPGRTEQAVLLYNQLSQMPFQFLTIQWDDKNNEWDTGKNAWATLAREGYLRNGWSLVLQDDAIISPNFYTSVAYALRAVPQQTCVSFYLGTTRPYNQKMTKAFDQASDAGASWLSGLSLHHGVCVALPTSTIKKVILAADARPNLQYDHRIGSYFKDRKLPVYYTMPSLCDHNDELESITNHKRKTPRVARMYQPEVVRDWNDKVVEIGV